MLAIHSLLQLQVHILQQPSPSTSPPPTLTLTLTQTSSFSLNPSVARRRYSCSQFSVSTATNPRFRVHNQFQTLRTLNSERLGATQVTMLIGLQIKRSPIGCCRAIRCCREGYFCAIFLTTDGCCPTKKDGCCTKKEDDSDTVSLTALCKGCCQVNCTAIFTGVFSLFFLLYDEGAPFRSTQVIATSLHPPLPLQPRNFAPYPI